MSRYCTISLWTQRYNFKHFNFLPVPFLSFFFQNKKKTKKKSWNIGEQANFLPTFLQMPKIDPMETRQSMLEEPSRGSKDTTYLPRSAACTSMHCSFSSDTITPTYIQRAGERERERGWMEGRITKSFREGTTIQVVVIN